MNFLFKYATRSRPEWFKKTISTYLSKQSGLHQFKFVITCDAVDRKMNNQPMRKWMEEQDLEYHFGMHSGKIQAINDNMKGHIFDTLIVVSDDMIPIVKGYDNIIAEDMQRYFPDLDGALHYNDKSHCGSKVISLSIMGRKLFDRFGYIYWPEYQSLWCDNEFTTIVRQLGKVQWIDKCIIKHEWKKGGTDNLYRRNEALYSYDKLIFDRRRQTAFPGALVDSTQNVLKPC